MMKHGDKIAEFAKQVRGLPGIIGEFGCLHCETTIKIAKVTNEAIYAYDTFEGIPYDDIHGLHKKGDYKSDFEKVQERVKPYKNIFLQKGKFEEHRLNDIYYSLAFIDCDVYQAAIYVYQNIKYRIVKNGILAFHDYGNKATPGIEKIVNRILEYDDGLYEPIYMNKEYEYRLAVFKRR